MQVVQRTASAVRHVEREWMKGESSPHGTRPSAWLAPQTAMASYVPAASFSGSAGTKGTACPNEPRDERQAQLAMPALQWRVPGNAAAAA